LHPVGAEITAPDRRQRDRGRRRDAADSDHHGQYVQRTGNNHVIHG
jgi:hypothetical protein